MVLYNDNETSVQALYIAYIFRHCPSLKDTIVILNNLEVDFESKNSVRYVKWVILLPSNFEQIVKRAIHARLGNFRCVLVPVGLISEFENCMSFRIRSDGIALFYLC